MPERDKNRLSEQDRSALTAVLDVLERRKAQYKSALLQAVLFRDGLDWRNGLTRLTASNEAASPDTTSLDYGDVVYIEEALKIDQFREFVATLAHEGSVTVGNYSVLLTNPETIGNAIHFSYSEYVTSGHRWLRSEWPANYYQYDGRLNRMGLPHHLLVGINKPLFPDANELVEQKFDIDIRQNNGLWGMVLLFLPNYRVQLGALKIGARTVTVQCDFFTDDRIGVAGKLFAKRDDHVVQTDFLLDTDNVAIDCGFVPQELEVCLIDTVTEELLDDIHLRADDISQHLDVDDINAETLTLLISQGEGNRLEFKTGKLDDKGREELVETGVAFANTEGGRLLVGVEDNGRVSGCFEVNVESRVTQTFVDRCDPPLDITVAKLVFDAKPVYLITVAESETIPHAVKGSHIYVRHGSNDFPITRAELDEMYAGKQRPSPARWG
jgi:hypothetical protein